MKTKEEIVAFMEQELENAKKEWGRWKSIDSSEAMKYRVKANTLEHLLEEIDPVENQTTKVDKNELKQKISDLEKRIKGERKKRGIIIVAAFTIVFFLLFYFFDKKPEDFAEFFKMSLASFLLSLFHFGINNLVFEYYFKDNKFDNSTLCELKKQLEVSDDI